MCPNQDEEVTNDPVMTAKEVAQYLRLTEATIYRLAKEGDIPGAKVGRVWRFKRSLIEKWLQDESLQPTA
jgi:excisionase family DNA binding protein